MLGWLVWPWAEQRKADRQLAALNRWRQSGDYLKHLWEAAEGYGLAHDWLGVEACYMKARAHLEE